MNCKKLISAALAFGVLLVNSGCDKKQTASSAKTVDWYMCKSAENMSSKDSVMKEANKIIEKELGITLDLHLIDMGNYDEKMRTMLATREKMDICFLRTAEQFRSGVKNGSFVELTDDMMQKYCPDILSQTDDYMWKFSEIDGKRWGIKGQTPLSDHPSIVFKKELVEKYNFDYTKVKSLADIESYLETIKKNEPNIYPLLYQTPDITSTRFTDMNISGLVYDEQQQKYISELDAEDFINRWKLKYKYYHKGYMPKDANTRNEYLTECKSGNYAVMCNTGYYTKDGSKTSSAYGFPCVEASMGIKPITTRSGSINSISSTTKSAENALKLLNLVCKDDYLFNTLAYGVEGIDYKIDEKRSAEIGEKSIIPNSGSMQTWCIWHNWIGPLWKQWDSPWNRREALEEMRTINETAQKSSSLGFIFDPESVKTEYAKMSSVRSEYDKILNVGCMENFDDYLSQARKKMKDAGIDTVIAEVNKQFSEWQTNNK